MRLFLVGIGGCGGKVAEKFLENQDLPLLDFSLGDTNSFGGVKGIWLEADVQETVAQHFFKPYDPYQKIYKPFYFIPHNSLPSESKTSKLMQEKYGYDLKKQGFFRQAEYLKAIFEIFESDYEVKMSAIDEFGYENPMLRSAWAIIRPQTTLAEAKVEGDSLSRIGKSYSRTPEKLPIKLKNYLYKSVPSLTNPSPLLCDGILFIVSLGGGTGTGFINPITNYIHYERSEFPIFVLGILTEEGWDKQQSAIEAKRDLSAVISLYDLLTKRRAQGIDGLILVDNQILIEKFGGDYGIIDEFICRSMKPLLASRSYPGENPPTLAIRQQFLEHLDTPPILIPFYHSIRKGIEEDLVENALNGGGLFRCSLTTADRAYVFARGIIDSKKMRDAITDRIGLPRDKIHVWRKLGGKSGNEVLILLRNPYGEPDVFRISGTLENRLYRIIDKATEYLDDYQDEVVLPGRPEITNEKLENYFYGEKGLKSKLKDALSRIELGKRPIFTSELMIFGVLDSQYQESQEEASEKALTEGKIRDIVEAILKEKGIL